jgi:hypothetical protein
LLLLLISCAKFNSVINELPISLNSLLLLGGKGGGGGLLRGAEGVWARGGGAGGCGVAKRRNGRAGRARCCNPVAPVASKTTMTTTTARAAASVVHRDPGNIQNLLNAARGPAVGSSLSSSPSLNVSEPSYCFMHELTCCC